MNITPEEVFYGSHSQPELSQVSNTGRSDPPFYLSKRQEVSSIPKATPDGSQVYWKYPSQQMYWNTLVEKGWRWEDHKHVTKAHLDSVLKNNNANMEKTWQEILKWEALHCNEIKDVKLKDLGDNLSPSVTARIKYLLGYGFPKERQDWIVDRDGKEVRYVIENYKNHGSVKIDVRPAPDSFENITDRIKNGTIGILQESTNLISKFISYIDRHD